ncbi:hypothetical protein [Magnetofaba australis]|uniref:Uncharacterized protein n=1 Tax=Magnetofaba australis IT-1 TaxID=1434232 RepID=A0A1Y2K1C9_9PROT|nr:hypothetical protein [Magnetofaba australis]OSM00111.1 hypothetical protein MAIT1_00536 [Magnetofaba australis IT-1]
MTPFALLFPATESMAKMALIGFLVSGMALTAILPPLWLLGTLNNHLLQRPTLLPWSRRVQHPLFWGANIGLGVGTVLAYSVLYMETMGYNGLYPNEICAVEWAESWAQCNIQWGAALGYLLFPSIMLGAGIFLIAALLWALDAEGRHLRRGADVN